MLVLTRKPGEQIVIPSLNVAVRLIEIRGDRIRLGIEAPQSVPVHRKEVWDRAREFQGGEDPSATPE